MKKFLFLLITYLMVFGFTFALPVPVFQAELGAEYNCKYVFTYKPYDECVKELNTQAQEAKQLEEQKKHEEYLNSPEYKQKLLEDKQKELEVKQAELEKKQKELEMKAEAMDAKARFTPEVESSKSALGTKASIIEGLVPVIKSKDSETQQKVGLILENFKASKDGYTRSVGIYLSYLLG